ncbi:MAG: low temperature requirement protein A [Cyanobacteria bacterium J06639_1]
MPRHQWWQKPVLRADEDRGLERRVSWLELFFDLYFVVVIAELSAQLARDVSWPSLGKFVVLFLPVWWVWIGSTYYIERFETEGVEHRLNLFALMIPISGLAVFARDGFGATSLGYGLSYAIARTYQTLLWWNAGIHNPTFRPIAKRLSIGSSAGFGCFYASCFVPPPLRFACWGIGLAFDMLTPAFTLEQQKKLPKLSRDRLPERYGLFVIIVLGEVIFGVVSGLAARETLTISTAISGILGIALAYGLWWIYFDSVGRPTLRPSIAWRLGWSYAHLPLTMAIAITGAGILNAIGDNDLVPDTRVRMLLSGAVATALLSVAIVEFCSHRPAQKWADANLSFGLKCGSAFLALALGWVSQSLHAIAFELLLFLPISIQIGYGLYDWLARD